MEQQLQQQGGIARKPVRSRAETINGNIRRKPVNRDSISLPAPKRPVALNFVLGPLGLHLWYDSNAVDDGHDGSEGVAEGEEEPPRCSYTNRYWSGVNDQRRWVLEENPLHHARTIQLYALSPHQVTAAAYTDQEGVQQHKAIPPYKALLHRVGKMKREFERSVEAEEDINGWMTLCLVNNQQPKDLRITFGPGESYYCRSPDKRVIRRGLPVDLESTLKSRDLPPAEIGLGVDSAWWIMWPDGSHEQYLQQHVYPDLCTLLENVEVPQLKKIMLNPAKANEFLVEYANGHFFLRARCQVQDLRRLNSYLQEEQSEIKIVVMGVVAKALGQDIVCAPFVMPVDDFEATPFAMGQELRPGQLPEWMEYTRNGIDLAKSVAETATAAGACSVM